MTHGATRAPRVCSRVKHVGPFNRRRARERVALGDARTHEFCEPFGLGQVADSDPAPADLVLVSGADPARGCSDSARPARGFAQLVAVAMVREHQVRPVADKQPPIDADARQPKLFHLVEERLEIDDNAVADDAGEGGVEDAGRNQAQDELPPADIHGVPRVVSALRPGDDGESRRQQVDDLALSLVAPLGTDNGDVHERALSGARSRKSGGAQSRMLAHSIFGIDKHGSGFIRSSLQPSSRFPVSLTAHR